MVTGVGMVSGLDLLNCGGFDNVLPETCYM